MRCTEKLALVFLFGCCRCRCCHLLLRVHRTSICSWWERTWCVFRSAGTIQYTMIRDARSKHAVSSKSIIDKFRMTNSKPRTSEGKWVPILFQKRCYIISIHLAVCRWPWCACILHFCFLFNFDSSSHVSDAQKQKFSSNLNHPYYQRLHLYGLPTPICVCITFDVRPGGKALLEIRRLIVSKSFIVRKKYEISFREHNLCQAHALPTARTSKLETNVSYEKCLVWECQSF